MAGTDHEAAAAGTCAVAVGVGLACRTGLSGSVAKHRRARRVWRAQRRGLRSALDHPAAVVVPGDVADAAGAGGLEVGAGVDQLGEGEVGGGVAAVAALRGVADGRGGSAEADGLPRAVGVSVEVDVERRARARCAVGRQRTAFAVFRLRGRAAAASSCRPNTPPWPPAPGWPAAPPDPSAPACPLAPADDAPACPRRIRPATRPPDPRSPRLTSRLARRCRSCQRRRPRPPAP